jgi:hypothetical protein
VGVITAAFGKLVDLVLKMPEMNAQNRQQIRDAVGSVAEELIRGLTLVRLRIEGAKVLARSSDKKAAALLQTYMAETELKLFDAFSELKICRGLRETRDRFTRPFDLAKASVRIQNIGTIDSLMNELEHDERMIIDEVGPLLEELKKAAEKKKPQQFLSLADAKIEEIQKREKRLRRLARDVIDKM